MSFFDDDEFRTQYKKLKQDAECKEALERLEDIHGPYYKPEYISGLNSVEEQLRKGQSVDFGAVRDAVINSGYHVTYQTRLDYGISLGDYQYANTYYRDKILTTIESLKECPALEGLKQLVDALVKLEVSRVAMLPDKDFVLYLEEETRELDIVIASLTNQGPQAVKKAVTKASEPLIIQMTAGVLELLLQHKLLYLSVQPASLEPASLVYGVNPALELKNKNLWSSAVASYKTYLVDPTEEKMRLTKDALVYALERTAAAIEPKYLINEDIATLQYDLAKKIEDEEMELVDSIIYPAGSYKRVRYCLTILEEETRSRGRLLGKLFQPTNTELKLLNTLLIEPLNKELKFFLGPLINNINNTFTTKHV